MREKLIELFRGIAHENCFVLKKIVDYLIANGCGMRYWDKQLRKAKIYHSLNYAKDVVDAYEECNCKIVEVSLAIVPEAKTNADRIRAMSDEELADIVVCPHTGNWDLCRDDCKKCRLEWLKQPAEVSENE